MIRVLIVLFLVLVASAPARAQSVVERLVSPGQLSAAHEGEAVCNDCHVSFDRDAQNTLCVECHDEVGRDLEADTGFHGQFPDVAEVNCKVCHSEHLGRDADILGFTETGFDHRFTDFELSGGHVDVPCSDCHDVEARYASAPLTCSGCHEDDDPHQGRMDQTCSTCHTVNGWESDIRFDHASTLFDLAGAHADADCMDCHFDQVWDGLSSDCVQCHQEDDAHSGRFGNECADCHVEEAWDEVQFDHRTTGFVLAGSHQSLDCNACHGADEPHPAPTSCVGCHREADTHEGLLGPNCQSCHSETSWTRLKFDHDIDTDFALLGAHAQQSCTDCHETEVAIDVPDANCGECHAADDPHRGQLGDGCGSCHGVDSWTRDVRFDHNFASFPLLGAHAQAECEDCHQTPAFLDASAACVNCHTDDDEHGGALGNDCAACHSPVSWSRWRFDHLDESGFALTGAHRVLQCASCHANVTSNGYLASSRCVSCHVADDKHRGSFGSNCSRCHNTEAFWAVEMQR